MGFHSSTSRIFPGLCLQNLQKEHFGSVNVPHQLQDIVGIPLRAPRLGGRGRIQSAFTNLLQQFLLSQWDGRFGVPCEMVIMGCTQAIIGYRQKTDFFRRVLDFFNPFEPYETLESLLSWDVK